MQDGVMWPQEIVVEGDTFRFVREEKEDWLVYENEERSLLISRQTAVTMARSQRNSGVFNLSDPVNSKLNQQE